jgi:Domain of unknown function (DUF1977)
LVEVEGFLSSAKVEVLIALTLLNMYHPPTIDLQSKQPFTNLQSTRLSNVKEIPYFVSDKFLRVFYHDRYQLTRVEHMVERAYENFLVKECTAQREFKKRLFTKAQKKELNEEEKLRQLKFASEYELSRCEELMDLFPDKQRTKRNS